MSRTIHALLAAGAVCLAIGVNSQPAQAQGIAFHHNYETAVVAGPSSGWTAFRFDTRTGATRRSMNGSPMTGVGAFVWEVGALPTRSTVAGRYDFEVIYDKVGFPRSLIRLDTFTGAAWYLDTSNPWFPHWQSYIDLAGAVPHTTPSAHRVDTDYSATGPHIVMTDAVLGTTRQVSGVFLVPLY